MLKVNIVGLQPVLDLDVTFYLVYHYVSMLCLIRLKCHSNTIL